MAIGIDIDFWGLLGRFEPHISFGGDMRLCGHQCHGL